MWVEGSEHAVDGGVFDVAEIDGLVIEVFLKELKDFTEASGQHPRAVSRGGEGALLSLNLNGELVLTFFVGDHHRCDGTLNGVQSGEEHSADRKSTV